MAEKLGTGLQNLVDGSVTRTHLHEEDKEPKGLFLLKVAVYQQTITVNNMAAGREQVIQATDILRKLPAHGKYAVDLYRACGFMASAHVAWGRLQNGSGRLFTGTMGELLHPFYFTGNPSDVSMLREVRTSGIYRHLSKSADNTTTNPILDLGANIGTTATFFASRFPNARVTAVEPDPRCVTILHRNLDPYGDRVDIISAAVSNEPGTAHQLNRAAELGNNYCAYRYGIHPEQEGETPGVLGVPAVTLPELYEKMGSPDRIAVLKLDIEGNEREIGDPLRELLEITDKFVAETHDRFRPGAHAVVMQAAGAAGLELAMKVGEDHLFVRAA